MRIAACRIELKRFLHEWRTHRIHLDLLRLEIVVVANRSKCGPLASVQLLADTALHVLAQVIHVVFALPESDIEHELALWCGFKPERREAKVFQCSRVQQIDDPPAVDTVSCQSIGMPRKNASGITSLDHGKHFAEPGSARFFGSFCFAKRGDDFQLFSL